MNVELLYVHYLEEIPMEESKLPIRIELLNIDTIERIQEVKKLNLPRLILRLERGDRCYVAITEQNKVASYHWVQEQGKHFIQQAGRSVEVVPGESWIYHVRVADEFKGNRINGAIYSRILQDAKKKGLQRVWVYTNEKNTSNRKGLERLRFDIDSKIYSLQVKGKFFQLYQKSLSDV